jgi:hypothetical protein
VDTEALLYFMHFKKDVNKCFILSTVTEKRYILRFYDSRSTDTKHLKPLVLTPSMT